MVRRDVDLLLPAGISRSDPAFYLVLLSLQEFLRRRPLNYLQPDGHKMFWRRDPLGRSLKGLIFQMDRLQDSGIHQVSLQEPIDTPTVNGQLNFHLFGGLGPVRAQFDPGTGAVQD